MADETRNAVEQVEEIGHDDYSLTRVPESERYSWFTVAVQRFGQLSALSQFLLGATLRFGMSFWSAFLALTLGAIILEIVAIFVGIAGMREGLSASVLARWSGFGRYGSALIGLVFAVSLIGWFGVQNAVFAEGVESLIGGLPVWAWSILTGLAVTLVVIYGFLSMAWVAYITVPAFLLLAGYSITSALQDYSLGQLVSSPAPGPELTLAAGTTIVAGGFIVGAVITPDMTRFNRSAADVIKQTVLGITLGEYTIGLIGVLLAHAVKSADVIEIVTSTSGVIGTIILVAGTLKINDWNLYSSTLGLANFIDTTVGRRYNRALITVVVGVLGTVLSAAGILGQFVGDGREDPRGHGGRPRAPRRGAQTRSKGRRHLAHRVRRGQLPDTLRRRRPGTPPRRRRRRHGTSIPRAPDGDLPHLRRLGHPRRDTIYGRGIPLFEGKVVDVERRTREGFAVGNSVLQGLGASQGSELKISFQNENLVAVKDGETISSVPDLICLLDSERATAITTERLRYGQRVTVIGIPTPEIMRTEPALRVWGPKAFGYEEDFVPLEKRFADYYKTHGVPKEKEKHLKGP